MEGGEAFVPAGHRAFPVALVVSDREVDELTCRFVVGEVAADADGFADDGVEALDLVGIRYERADAWLTDRRVAGRLRASGTGALGATQDGQAGLAGWAESPR